VLKDEDGYSVGDLSTSSLNVDPLGSDSAAGRIIVEYTSSDIDADGEASIDRRRYPRRPRDHAHRLGWGFGLCV